MPKKANSTLSDKTKEHRRQKKQSRRQARKRQQVQRERRWAAQTRYAKEVRQIFGVLLDALQGRHADAHGNATWTVSKTIAQTLLWVISEKQNSTDAFESATKQCRHLYGTASFRSYNGMMKVLVRYLGQLTEAVQEQLRKKVKELLGQRFYTEGWVVLAVDGSRDLTPRSEANERAFRPATYGHGKTAKYRRKKTKGMRRRANKKKPPAPPVPQVWMTKILHINSGLPWAWKLGPGNASERQHTQEMLKNTIFPDRSLFVGDAGFVGYEFWQTIIHSGHDFVVRVGANVRLLEGLEVERQTRGKNSIVYCWPKSHRKKSPPMKLRFIEVELGGEKATLLTSVLDHGQLSDQSALAIYKSRWSIELSYRDLKQTFARRVLRSRDPERALAELSFSILACGVLRFFGLRSHRTRNQQTSKMTVRQVSFASVLRTFRNVFEDLLDKHVQQQSIADQLRCCVHDEYNRRSRKRSRYRNTQKEIPKCGNPQVTRATAEERKTYVELQRTLAC